MKRPLALVLLLLLLTAPHRSSAAPSREAASSGLSCAPTRGSVVRCFERFELRLRFDAKGNPFDPSQVRVRGHFLSPRGRRIAVDGFWFQDFERTLRDGCEVLQAKGAPEWRVRFTPDETGTWGYTITARDGTVAHTCALRTFRALRPLSGHLGFVRTLGRYFAEDETRPFFPVGENLVHAGPQATYAYDAWIERLARQRATYVRLWAGPTGPLALERTAGRYDLQAAWRLDHVLDEARRHGLRVALCADSFSSLRVRPGPALWPQNPYNRARGGFLSHPWDFFRDARARTLYAHRLAYLSARYGYSPSLFSWELMNEADLSEGFEVPAVRDWVVQMADTLRRADPYAHPITVSFGASEGVPEIDRLPQIDYVQTHLYNSGDLSLALSLACRDKARLYDRPNLVTEAGASVLRAVNERDTDDGWLHDALWAPLFAGAAGTGMPWWWDSAIDARNRYEAFGAVERFARGVPWLTQAWRPLRVLETRFASVPAKTRGDLLICPPRGGWQRASFNAPVVVAVNRDGTVTGEESLSRLLHGRTAAALHNPATFVVDVPTTPYDEDLPPRDRRFVVHIPEPAPRKSRLQIELDGRLVLDEALDMNDAEPVRSRSVAIGMGRHIVRVLNAGSGAIPVAYELPGYRRADRPWLRVQGLASDTQALVWVRNEERATLRRMLDRSARPVPASVVVLDKFLTGDYVVEEWNTTTGTSIPREQRCVDGHITLYVPTLRDDIAYRIRPAP